MRLVRLAPCAVAIVGMAGSAFGQLLEIEPNHTKADALINGPFLMSDGMWLGGVSTGASTTTPGIASADYFLVQNAARPLGIYRHRLVLTSQIAGHAATIRGLNQIAAPLGPWTGTVGTPGTTDAVAQTGFIPAGTTDRIVQWYGFGKQEQFYYRVTGTASTTEQYRATLVSEPVTPVNLGTFQEGAITITTVGQGHSTDTDLWIYDSQLNAIVGYGNDDANPAGGAPATSLQSWLTRNYTPGTYYLALTNFQFALSQPSPSDDNFRTGTLTDFPNIAVNSSATVNLNLTFSVTDSLGTTQFPATKVGQFDVFWGQFTVIPAPGAMALLAVGGLFMANRRRR